jgi:hypothetical protein
LRNSYIEQGFQGPTVTAIELIIKHGWWASAKAVSFVDFNGNHEVSYDYEENSYQSLVRICLNSSLSLEYVDCENHTSIWTNGYRADTVTRYNFTAAIDKRHLFLTKDQTRVSGAFNIDTKLGVAIHR